MKKILISDNIEIMKHRGNKEVLHDNKVKLSHILKPVYFFAFATILEMINFLWLRFHVTGNVEVLQFLPKYFFLDVAIYLFIGAVIFLL